MPPFRRSAINPPRAELPLSLPKIEQLTEDEVIQLLESFVSNSVTTSFEAVSDIYTKDIKMHDVFIYSLTTTTETRCTKWKYTPYQYGDVVDGPGEGLPDSDDPWFIRIDLVPKSKESERVTIPRTDRVARCHHCKGTGQVTCYECGGVFTRRCNTCRGSGRIACITCMSRGKIKLYLTVKAYWKTRTTIRVVDTSGSNLRARTFINRKSTTILNETHDNVPYVAEVFDDDKKYLESLVKCMNDLIIEHEEPEGSVKKVVSQNQVIEHLPLAVINYKYKDCYGNFYVVGHDKKVKFDDYPTKQCLIL